MTSLERQRQLKIILEHHALSSRHLRTSKAAFGRTLLTLATMIQDLSAMNDSQMDAYEAIDVANRAALKLFKD
jgi:hypothetical protein